MDKYDIENNIDFFSELYKSLDDSTDEELDAGNTCLITDQPLVDFFVTMKCGHKFNYSPLYLDIKNHKQKFNTLESISGRLGHNELRCPYCRNKQVGVLPYYEEIGLPKVHGINYIDPNYKSPHSFSSYKDILSPCEFLTPNECFDPSGNDIVEVSDDIDANCKFYKCCHLGSHIKSFNGSTGSSDNYGDNKPYCWTHKKQVIKCYKQAKIAKARQEQKDAKLKIKEEIKQAKDLEKQQAKEAKQQAKELEKQQAKEAKQQAKGKKQKVVCENVVIGPSIVGNVSDDTEAAGCGEILKAGPNKGCKCGKKIYFNNVCKRHLHIETNL